MRSADAIARRLGRSLGFVVLALFFMFCSWAVLILLFRIDSTLAPYSLARSRAPDLFVQMAFLNVNHWPVPIEHPSPNFELIDRPEAYSQPPRRYVWHAAMIATPYVMYAPAPGSVEGDFHNAQQFRHRQDLGPKTADEIRIFVTGGSTAWGAGSPGIDTTIAAFLAAGIKAASKPFTFRVVNAAAGGWTTTDERTWILNRITEFEPDLIVSYSGHNDIAENRDILNLVHNDAGYYFHAIREYDRFNTRSRPFDIAPDQSRRWYDHLDFPRKTLKNVQIITAYLNTIDVPYVFALQPFNKKRPARHRLPSELSRTRGCHEGRLRGWAGSICVFRSF